MAKTRTIPLLPLRDIIVFPHMVVPLFVGRDKSIKSLEEAMSGDKEVLLAAQKLAKTNDPKPEDIFSNWYYWVDHSTTQITGWNRQGTHRREAAGEGR